jgi:hypothetical protein
MIFMSGPTKWAYLQILLMRSGHLPSAAPRMPACKPDESPPDSPNRTFYTSPAGLPCIAIVAKTLISCGERPNSSQATIANRRSMVAGAHFSSRPLPMHLERNGTPTATPSDPQHHPMPPVSECFTLALIILHFFLNRHESVTLPIDWPFSTLPCCDISCA